MTSRNLPNLQFPVALIGLIALAGWLFVRSFWHELPERVAVHWDIAGQPDRWEAPARALSTQLGLGVLVPAAIVGLGFLLGRTKALSAVAVGVALFLVFVLSGGLWAQRAGASGAWPGPLLPLGLVAGLAGGLCTYLVVRDRHRMGVAKEPLPAGVPVLTDAPAWPQWRGAIRSTKAGAVAVGLGLLLLLVPAVVLWFTGQRWMSATMVIVALAIGILAGSMRATVVVDGSGVRARSLCITWGSAPLEAIEYADVERVNPLREFGGWGARVRLGGGSGIVGSAGEALVVHRNGTDPLYLTVNDAEAAAATVNTFVERRNDRRG